MNKGIIAGISALIVASAAAVNLGVPKLELSLTPDARLYAIGDTVTVTAVAKDVLGRKVAKPVVRLYAYRPWRIVSGPYKYEKQVDPRTGKPDSAQYVEGTTMKVVATDTTASTAAPNGSALAAQWMRTSSPKLDPVVRWVDIECGQTVVSDSINIQGSIVYYRANPTMNVGDSLIMKAGCLPRYFRKVAFDK